MNLRFMTLCDELRRETNPERAWTFANEALGQYGVSSILYCAIAFKAEAERPNVSKAAFVKSNHPQQYFDSFEDEGLLDADLTTEHCVTRTDLLFWHNEAQWSQASNEQLKRAKIERDLGLFMGVSVPASRFGPRLIGGVGLCMAGVGIKEFDGHWRENAADILAICGVLDSGMRRQHLSHFIGLSSRERECMTWLAAGLRPEQIADRLGITRSSVDKYITKARLKLKSGTLEQAVAKAILFNVIQP